MLKRLEHAQAIENQERKPMDLELKGKVAIEIRADGF